MVKLILVSSRHLLSQLQFGVAQFGYIQCILADRRAYIYSVATLLLTFTNAIYL